MSVQDQPATATGAPPPSTEARGSPASWTRGLVGGVVDPDALALALEAGTWPTSLGSAERRAFALLVLALLSARIEGGTRLRVATAVERLASLGAAETDRASLARLLDELPRLAGASPGDLDRSPPSEFIALAPFIGRPGDYRPLIMDDGSLYTERDLRIETRLAAALRARIVGVQSASDAMPAGSDRRSPTAPAGQPARLWTDEQRSAIEASTRLPLTVITGGPGTGKTALIGGIADAWVAQGLGDEDIAIAAPTGKAASRIGEMLPPGRARPQTLHRLLGLASAWPGPHASEFRHHEQRPLRQRAVILDEASMVGMTLMDRLLRSLRPEARLVLIGDADQLPAVDAGRVFGDLARVAVRLTVSHRMNPDDPAGAAVLAAARAIASGELNAPTIAAPRSPDSLPSAGLTCIEPPRTGANQERRLVTAFVRLWFERWLDPGRAPASSEAQTGPDPYRHTFEGGRDGPGLEPADAAFARSILEQQRRLRLLTVTRLGPFGSERINQAIQAAVSNAVGSSARRGEASAGLVPMRAGTPVVMMRNDYERGLWNGEQGVILTVASRPARRPELAAVFSRAEGVVAFPLRTLEGALTLGYASTVHKAQGSELDHGALLLPDEDMPLLSRELVYTAVTRARRSITIVGRRDLLEAAVKRPVDRASGIAERVFG